MYASSVGMTIDYRKIKLLGELPQDLKLDNEKLSISFDFRLPLLFERFGNFLDQ